MLKEFFLKNKWLLVVGLAAVLVRLIYLMELSSKPGFTVPLIDERWHWEWAKEIIESSFWGSEAYFSGPLYPYFLAMLRWITDGSVFFSKFLQIFLCAGTAIFIYRLAENLFGRTVAVISGLIYAFYGTLVFYETMFLIPVLYLFLLTWGMFRVVAFKNSDNLKSWLLTGLILGMAALARPNLLAIIPFLAIWLFFIRSTKPTLFRRAATGLVLLAGVTIAILPVTMRNKIVTGELMLISSQGGINLYLGNNKAASGLTTTMPEVDLFRTVNWKQFLPVTNGIAERESGRDMTAGEISSFWRDKAITFIKENPATFMELTWQKFVYLFSGFENSDNTDIYYQRSKSVLYSLLIWNKVLMFPFGLLLPLTLLGIFFHRERTADLAPIYIFLVAYIPTIILFIVTARYRLPMLPFMIILAAAGIHTLVTSIRKMPAIRIGVASVLALTTLVLVNQTWYNEGHTNDFQNHYNSGLKAFQLDDFISAEREFLKADEVYPYSGQLLNHLGYVQYLLGKYQDADSSFRRSMAAYPENSQVYNNFGLLVAKQGLSDSAVILYRKAIALFDSTRQDVGELARFHMNLGDVYESQNRIDSASDAFILALAISPDSGRYCFRAAAYFARHEYYDRSDSLYSVGMHLHEPAPSDFFNWGLSLLERKMLPEGILMMHRVLNKDPTLYQANYCLATAHLELGAPRDSIVKYLDLCFETNPGFQPALRLKEALNQQ